MKYIKENTAFIWKYISPLLPKIWYVWPVLLVVVAASLAEPYIYKLVVDALTTLIGGQIDIVFILKLMAIWCVVSTVNMFAFWIYRRTFSANLHIVENNYMDDMYRKVLHKDVAQHLEHRSGEIMKKVDRVAEGLWRSIYDIYMNAIPTWLTMLATLIFAFVISWKMTLVLLLLVPFVIWVFVLGVLKSQKLHEELSNKITEAYSFAYDAVMNVFTVKSFAQEKREHHKFISVLDQLSKIQKTITLRWGNIDVAEHLMQILMRFVIFAAGIYFIYTGEMTVGTLIFFLAISSTIYSPLQSLGWMIRNFQEMFVKIDQARVIMSKPDLVVDEKNAKNLEVIDGRVEMKNVSFHYEKKRLGILSEVSLEFEPGKITALVGHSGAGKSTVTSVINRFYDVTEGEILIDGQDLRKVTLKSLRENIGMVMQENTMFNETIAYNIKYARPDISDAEMIGVAKQAQLHDFVDSLPDKYQTKIGERGLKLSGGEKQRLAIARAILKNPPILILDEATSALDTKTEREIQSALDEVMKGRTSIVIAHRLSTVRKADKIVVLDKGKVAQVGTHQQLMEQEGIYKELVELQTQGFLGR